MTFNVRVVIEMSKVCKTKCKRTTDAIAHRQIDLFKSSYEPMDVVLENAVDQYSEDHNIVLNM